MSPWCHHVTLPGKPVTTHKGTITILQTCQTISKLPSTHKGTTITSRSCQTMSNYTLISSSFCMFRTFDKFAIFKVNYPRWCFNHSAFEWIEYRFNLHI